MTRLTDKVRQLATRVQCFPSPPPSPSSPSLAEGLPRHRRRRRLPQQRCSNRSGARIFLLTKAISALFFPSLFLPPSLPLAPLHFTLSPPHSLPRSLPRYFRVFLCEQRRNERGVERCVRVGGENVQWR